MSCQEPRFGSTVLKLIDREAAVRGVGEERKDVDRVEDAAQLRALQERGQGGQGGVPSADQEVPVGDEDHVLLGEPLARGRTSRPAPGVRAACGRSGPGGGVRAPAGTGRRPRRRRGTPACGACAPEPPRGSGGQVAGSRVRRRRKSAPMGRGWGGQYPWLLQAGFRRRPGGGRRRTPGGSRCVLASSSRAGLSVAAGVPEPGRCATWRNPSCGRYGTSGTPCGPAGGSCSPSYAPCRPVRGTPRSA